MLELILCFQNPIESRFTGNVLPTIGQPRHDLARGQMSEFVRVRHRHYALAFQCTELVLRPLQSHRALITAQHIALPALQGTFAQTDGRTGALLTRAHDDSLAQ